ncbi:MAG: DNA adenine methylase [Firmicutes bacterium]|nr:DNA adenine methylase [Bacillota bacterium]
MLAHLLERVPREFDTYFEPFVGGGALFFALSPGKASLNDRNEELMNAYSVVQSGVDGLIESLRRHEAEFFDPERGGSTYYYRVRAVDPATLSPVERASRFIFLNKTCYNGLWRENAAGQFNVPFGRYKNPRIADADNLRKVSAALRGVTFTCKDFEEAVEGAGRGSFVYFDPPYHPLSETASFTKYVDSGFGPDDQKRLARVIADAGARGAYVMLSNSATSFIKELYAHYPGFGVEIIQAKRPINCRADGRGFIDEFIIRNY